MTHPCAIAVVCIGLALSTLGVLPQASAQSRGASGWMSRNEIVEAFVGRQLSGAYPSGTPWSELIRPDGTSDYREGAARREGRWWMRNEQFCFTYALPQSDGCFQVARIGLNCQSSMLW